ncbi:gluconate 2-dehydrogenase subunit 3 family protein [Pseudomonas corrugata]|jgi:hypothetical protein|uniref:gluconate 2-dehydrogenase subunit 3 family protein n=1 Tax=Pseudomonas corrugata TaxID=47879 RepID=UPI0028C4B1EB|nr:gluconate 2-dehydrogenase subunit 3 family protein [Pseudomonas corrugata]MDU9025153.1 gluconate 2-dehydrogenase subunit 3 family protein [Pseudomonas corrugata]
MKSRYPGYDVMQKRHGPSWNDATRSVIDQRLALPVLPRFFNEAQWRTLQALCGCVLPQPDNRVPVPVAAMVDDKLYNERGDGFIDTRLPPPAQAWCMGLAAIDAEALARQGVPFAQLSTQDQRSVITAIEQGSVMATAWNDLPSQLLFRSRLMHDIASAYYSHPTAWSEVGFGGPASPRGYVRLGPDRRDAWEAVELKDTQVVRITEANRNVR